MFYTRSPCPRRPQARRGAHVALDPQRRERLVATLRQALQRCGFVGHQLLAAQTTPGPGAGRIAGPPSTRASGSLLPRSCAALHRSDGGGGPGVGVGGSRERPEPAREVPVSRAPPSCGPRPGQAGSVHADRGSPLPKPFLSEPLGGPGGGGVDETVSLPSSDRLSPSCTPLPPNVAFQRFAWLRAGRDRRAGLAERGAGGRLRGTGALLGVQGDSESWTPRGHPPRSEEQRAVPPFRIRLCSPLGWKLLEA